jgi:hypothetical protein
LRSYIFTPTERGSIELFLDGKIRGSDARVAHILSRMRSFTELSKDIDLYLRLRKAVTTTST